MLESIAFSVYGFSPSRASGLALRYSGYVFDPHVLSYQLGNGYRQYHPVLMRFCSADTSSPFESGGINAYAYCAGDPVNHSDSSGHQRTGLTALLKQYGLRKRDVKFHLRILAEPELRGMSLSVSKQKGDQFITYRFTGESPLIRGERAYTEPLNIVAGEYYQKDNIFIAPPNGEVAKLLLKKHGYELIKKNSETHAFLGNFGATSAPISAGDHLRSGQTSANLSHQAASVRRP